MLHVVLCPCDVTEVRKLMEAWKLPTWPGIQDIRRRLSWYDGSTKARASAAPCRGYLFGCKDNRLQVRVPAAAAARPEARMSDVGLLATE